MHRAHGVELPSLVGISLGSCLCERSSNWSIVRVAFLHCQLLAGPRRMAPPRVRIHSLSPAHSGILNHSMYSVLFSSCFGARGHSGIANHDVHVLYVETLRVLPKIDMFCPPLLNPDFVGQWQNAIVRKSLDCRVSIASRVLP